jgi:hypothetical protein
VEDESKNGGLIKLFENLNEVTCGSFSIIHEKSATVAKISSGIFSEKPSSTLDIPLSTKGTKMTSDHPTDDEETRTFVGFIGTGLNADDDDVLK